MVANRIDHLIANSRSWDDLCQRLVTAGDDAPDNKFKGDVFERLTQLYLQTAPEYQSVLSDVWNVHGELPRSVRKRLGLPNQDVGIDLIAKTRQGDYWSIQCKFRSDQSKPLTYKELSTFSQLSFVTCADITLAIVVHTTSKPVRKRKFLPRMTEIGLDRWLAIPDEDWQLIRAHCQSRAVKIKPRRARPHQRKAITAAKKHFVTEKNSRGRLIMPCGTGKSLTAFWIAEALKSGNTLVAVPSLALVRQSLSDWTREFLAHGIVPDWLCICSDESTGKLDQDEFVSGTYDLGIPTTTDPSEIAAFMERRGGGHKIVFTTYHSTPRLAKAAQAAKFSFDLAVFDEAHKTVGAREKAFATLLFEKNINIRKRLFMTATERVLRGKSDELLSMNDPSIYGQRFHLMTFKDAIAQKVISDYKIVTMTVSSARLKELISENRILSLDPDNLDEAEAQSLAAGIALKRLHKKQKVKHAISFHRSIRSAERFSEQQDALNELKTLGPASVNLHVSCKKTAGERAQLLRDFAEEDRALISNARCLTEGVDIPAVDCVLFADPKQSVIDIVQAAGRALRLHDKKKYGYILVPLVIPDDMQFDEFAEQTAFKQVVRVLTALSTHDERIAEEFRVTDKGHNSSGRIVEITGDVTLGMKMELGEFADAILTRVWERVGRANWREFEEARAYVQGLGLKIENEWREFLKSGKRPEDIPSNPGCIYTDKGWAGMGDWLGTGNVANRDRVFRPFKQARDYVQGEGLKSQAEWQKFTKLGKLPEDIPANPHQFYKGKGWGSWGDWLGTGTIANQDRVYSSFDEARHYVQGLGINGQAEWRKFTKSGELLENIPADPAAVYKDNGWNTWGDWLGTGRIASRDRVFRSFDEARDYAQGLALKSKDEWTAFTKSGNLPENMPANPSRTYKDKGWAGMGDWLGTGTIAVQDRVYRSFDEARIYAQSLGLGSVEEWWKFTKSGNLPEDIPANPYSFYKDKGWTGIRDWLGTGTIAPRDRVYKPFKQARIYAQSLGFGSGAEWQEFAKLGNLPEDIPTDPYQFYKNKGWVGWGDWLGTGNVAPKDRVFRSFDEARDYVQGLRLKNSAEWRKFTKSGRLPKDIPADLPGAYKNNGWDSWGDWLGTGYVAPRYREYRPFKQARVYAQSLGLGSVADWRKFTKSGNLPEDIPANPYQFYKDKGWTGIRDWLGTSEPQEKDK